MAISEVSICNQALSWLGGNRITSLDDPSTEAQVCKENYEVLRDAVLETADWSFAIKRYRLTPDVAVPEYGYTSAFSIGGDILRVLGAIYADDSQRTKVTPWALEDKKILCDETVIYFRAVTRVTDTSKFSTLFTQALSARIAAEISRPLTSKNDSSLWDLYTRKLGEAMANDGMQGVNQEFPTGRLISRRFGGGS